MKLRSPERFHLGQGVFNPINAFQSLELCAHARVLGPLEVSEAIESRGGTRATESQTADTRIGLRSA